jgi:hypothetical protein
VAGFATVLAIWAAAGALLTWGLLPVRWRVAISVAISVVGLVFLMLALGTEGFRETQSTTVLLLGPPRVTSLASASASLPYYVLTGACLLLGSLGVVTSEAAARWLARRFVLWAAAVSVMVMVMRFLLEKAAAPPSLAAVFGVVWLPPVVGAWFYARGRHEPVGLGRLAGWLLAYGLLVRASVVAFYAVATRLGLGSHYDVSAIRWIESPWGAVYHFEPGSFDQLLRLVVLPQMLVWPLFTVVSGLLGAAMAAVILRAGARVRAG